MPLTKPCPRRGQPHCLGVIRGRSDHAREFKRRKYCCRKCGGQAKLKTRPICGCGCGGHVRLMHHQFLAGHVPSTVKSAGARKGRLALAFKQRRQRYAAIMARLTNDSRVLTKEALMQAFAEVERHGYDSGYHACEAKWSGRKFYQRKTAA